MTTKILDTPNQLAETLHELINRDGKLTPASLARKIGIPTNKITRILNGDVTDPKASTLIQIANCFDIKIEQLLGLEPITKRGEYSDTVSSQIIPIYGLTHFNYKNQSKDWYRWVDNEIAGNYFAISVDTDLYEPIFPETSLLIINPDVVPEDRSFIIITKKNNPTYCIIKKYVLDGDLIYLYPINPKLSIEINDENLHIILGVILEVHQKLQKIK